MSRWLLGLGFAAACSSGEPATSDSGTTDTGVPVAPCERVGDPVAALKLAEGEYGELVDGVSIPVGIPPQGGAPYTPFEARMSGVGPMDAGVAYVLTATDPATGAPLGDIDGTAGLICANVGDDAGSWVTLEMHLRYWGLLVADLDGKPARIDVALDGLVADAHFTWTVVGVLHAE